MGHPAPSFSYMTESLALEARCLSMVIHAAVIHHLEKQCFYDDGILC